MTMTALAMNDDAGSWSEMVWRVLCLSTLQGM
jgi:hypothetical protein